MACSSAWFCLMELTISTASIRKLFDPVKYSLDGLAPGQRIICLDGGMVTQYHTISQGGWINKVIRIYSLCLKDAESNEYNSGDCGKYLAIRDRG